MIDMKEKRKTTADADSCGKEKYRLKSMAFLTQFDKGSGSFRREQNIRKIAKFLKSGVSEEETRFRLSLSFKASTVDDYLRTARELLRRESKVVELE